MNSNLLRTSYQVAPLNRFRRHHLVEKLAILPPTSEAFLKIRGSIKAGGIQEPLKCVVEGEYLLVVDGIHRLTIAEELKISDLPYLEVCPDEALNAICSSLVRADWSKSALAYRMWPLFEACCFGRGGNRKSNRNDCGLITVREIADKLGISEKLVEQAKRLHGFFAKNPKVRESQESEILLGERPLHRAGSETPSPPSKESIPIMAIESHLTKLPRVFHAWDKIPHSQRERAKDTLATALSKLPQDVQKTAYDALEIALGH